MFIRRLPQFEYHAPTSIGEALDLSARFADDGRFIAGGTDLLVEMKRREVVPAHLISLGGITALRGIDFDEEKGLRIGALTTLANIERSEVIRRRFPPLGDAVDVMASAQIRTLATIGGNLCHSIPSADTAPPLIALGSSLKLVGPSGERRVQVEDFFLGPKQSVREKNEILTEIQIPTPAANSSGCYLKLMRRHAMDLALVGVAAWLRLDPSADICREARIALGAVAPTPIRAREVEAVIIGNSIDEALVREAARIAGGQCRSRETSIRASREYRCQTVEVLTRRAILQTNKLITGQG